MTHIISVLSTLPSTLLNLLLLLFTLTFNGDMIPSEAVKTERLDHHNHSYRRLQPNYFGNLGFASQQPTVTVPVPADAEHHRVTDLPLLDASTITTPHYAGLLPAGKSDHKYFFYWFFHPELPSNYPQDKEVDIPLVIWLNGGPGCSSMDGLFLEHGPLQLQVSSDRTQWKLVARTTSWHKAPAYMVYVDQPVGTGLSFTTKHDYPTSDEAVNADFYGWLVEFVTLHKDVLMKEDGTGLKRPFYFTGESHAGHYIPSMMAYIQEQNMRNENKIKFTLTGAAIGNGWMDPYHQYAAAEAAYGHGLIDLSQKYALAEQEKQCQSYLERGEYVAGVCFSLLDSVVDESFGSSSHRKVSQYDIRQSEPKRGSRTFPPGHKDVESYLGGFPVHSGPLMPPLDDVLAALHSTQSRDAGQVFQECTDPPYSALSHQDGKGVVAEVISLLNNDVRILFFNGVMDLICNHVGNEVLLEKLQWKHQHEWIQTPRYAWMSGSKANIAGYVKEFENLSFLKVLDSGHMVPLDQPEVSLEMMSLFLYKDSFQSSRQNLESIDDQGESKGDDGDESCPECPTCPLSPGSDSIGGNAHNDGSTFKYVIAHSWLGAIVAVLSFLGVYCFLASSRRRQVQQPVLVYRDDDDDDDGHHNNNGVEMKNRYRDNGYRDEVEDDDDNDDNDKLIVSNGTMI